MKLQEQREHTVGVETRNGRHGCFLSFCHTRRKSGQCGGPLPLGAGTEQFDATLSKALGTWRSRRIGRLQLGRVSRHPRSQRISNPLLKVLEPCVELDSVLQLQMSLLYAMADGARFTQKDD